MGRRGLIGQIVPRYAALTAASLLALVAYAAYSFRGMHLKAAFEELEAEARLAAGQVRGVLRVGDHPAVDALCKQLAADSGTRFTVILPSGLVAGDSSADPSAMDNHGDRPEVRDAQTGGVGRSRRFSTTLQQDLLYVALPLIEGDSPLGIVRAALPLEAVTGPVWTVLRRMAYGAALLTAVAGALGWVFARRLAESLDQLRRGAERFAQGDLAAPLPSSRVREVAGLSEAMGAMARQIDERIRAGLTQLNEQEAVLRSMVEGVLAVDREERIISMNQAAARFLGADAAQAQGKPLQAVVRNTALRDFVRNALASPETLETEIMLRRDGVQTLQIHGTVLRDEAGEGIGAMVVLNDVTRLRQLEQVRRDFVANVSHELKTPITSIKGFVETLLDGAIENVEDARRFLEIVARHVDRLNTIIDDLLTLSRLEREEEPEIYLEPADLRNVLEGAVELCRQAADAKGIRIEIRCDEALSARINPPLIERAVVNLVDNAIKYSGEGSRVAVEGRSDGGRVLISVRDQGCGIPAAHLPRLFERFYRVDQARSRQLGGTGLGLSIVRHIAQCHHGKVAVESEVGRGSTFILELPAEGDKTGAA